MACNELLTRSRLSALDCRISPQKHFPSMRKPPPMYHTVVVPLVLLCTITAVATCQSNSSTPEDWQFIDNGQLKLGVKKSSGAAIGWLSLSGSPDNLVNHFDRGRLIQQSYYGLSDGSIWDKQPWRRNPVQGGHYKGNGAPVLELNVKGSTIYSKSYPVHWATGETLTDCLMEQTIELQNAVAKIHFRFTYSGKIEHPVHDQEVPAVFLEPQFKNLVLYAGKKPWSDDALERSLPGWPNERRSISEHWAAYVDDNNFGLGAYVPMANELTCYRFGDGNREHGSCSYFAPLVRLAIKPGFVLEYDVFLAIGKLDTIRHAFHHLADKGDQ